jgi:hypothetical protein
MPSADAWILSPVLGSLSRESASDSPYPRLLLYAYYNTVAHASVSNYKFYQ